MAGIYIHVPWCRKVCVYCDFHFSVSMKNRDALIACLLRELELRSDYLKGKKISSIYFGGGTPSILNSHEISLIIEKSRKIYDISDDAEITLEANPDDLTINWLKQLKHTGVNRLSIGVQSFFNDDLNWMNRRHNESQSINSVKNSQDAGFDNINIDLIYGLPGMSNKRWIDNLNIGFSLNISHLSAYNLTLENKTVYKHQVLKGNMAPPDENKGHDQFEIVMDYAADAGFVHYEISNFSLPENLSRHNSSYWKQIPYIGIGPSAHSFNGEGRQWNIRNNSKYIESIKEGRVPFEAENLTLADKFNEYLLTSLRTMWGVNETEILKRFGSDMTEYFNNGAERVINSGMLIRKNKEYYLTRRGKHFADSIISDLFYSENHL